MSNVWTISRHEFTSYFRLPAAYVVLVVFLAVTGYLFTLFLLLTREANLQHLFRSMGIVLVFLVPALTMRLVAEEKRSGTLDLLLACPLRDWELVLGKYLGSLAFSAVLLLSTVHYPLFLIVLGRPDYVPIAIGYLGALLLMGVFLAVGLWASTLTQSQVVAYVAAFGVVLLFWALDGLGNYAGGGFADLLTFLALSRHYDDFTRGILDSRHIVYYLSWVIFFLVLSSRSLSFRKWL